MRPPNSSNRPKCPKGGVKRPKCPGSYEIWLDGVWKPVKDLEPEQFSELKKLKWDLYRPMPSERREYFERITAAPIWVARVGRDVDPEIHSVYLELRYGSGGRSSRWINWGQLATRQRLLQLAMEGIPITETAVLPAMRYLEASTRLAEQKRQVLMASRMGLHRINGHKGWLIGKDWIGPKGTKVLPAPTISQIKLKSYIERGRFDSWWKRFRQLRDDAGPVARWLVYAMFASPLLGLTETNGFLVHHHGKSGSGKTAIAEFGMSVWGQVKRAPTITGTFNATAMAMTAQFQDVNDFPLCFDELQAATFKDKVNDISSLVMAMVLGKPRQRLSPTGELSTLDYSWKSIVRFTGEQELVSDDSNALEGVANRVLQLQAEALTSTQALSLHKWMERSGICGVAGRRFLRKLVPWVNSARAMRVLKKWNREVHDRLQKEVGSVHDPRLIHLGHIAFAHALVNFLFLGRVEGETYRELWNSCVPVAISDAVAIANEMGLGRPVSFLSKAVGFLQDHLAQHPESYIDVRDREQAAALRDGRYERLIGVLNPRKDQKIWYISSAINPILRRANLNPGRVWSDLDRQRCLVLQQSRVGRGASARDRKVRRRAGKFDTRVYCVSRWPDY